MDYVEEADLQEKVARLSARVAELEERLVRLESGGPGRTPVAAREATGSVEPVNPVTGEELLAGIRAVLERLGEAEAGQIRQELIKNGFTAALTRSDINKVLYRHTDLFGKASGEASKPEWYLV
jgi:hypothetical protein